MNATIDEVQKYVAEENPTVEVLIHKYGNQYDHWKLRTLRRDVLTQVAEDLIGPDSVTTSSPFRNLPRVAQAAIQAGFLRPINIELRDVPKIPVSFLKAYRTTAVLPDLHAPDHDEHALDVTIQICQSLGIDSIILNGDAFDVHSLSKYTTSAEKPFRWVEEREKAVPVLATIREAFPETPIDYVFGNHCIRPLTFIDSKAPQLQGIFTLPYLLGIEDLNFNFPEGNRVLLGEEQLLVKHGVKVSKHGGASVLKEVQEHGMSVMMGHIHRCAQIEVTNTSQAIRGLMPYIGIELGCLCSLRPDYITEEETANWQNAFGVVTEYGDGLYHPELVRIHGGHAMFRGRLFRSRHLS